VLSNIAPQLPIWTGQLPRVCLLLERFYPTVGGTVAHASNLAEKLTESGIKVMIVTMQQKAQLAKWDRVRGIPVYRIPSQADWALKKVRAIISTLLFLIKMRKSYDIIYVVGYRMLGIPAILVCSLFQKPCVLRQSLHGELLGESSNYGLQQVKVYPRSFAIRIFLWLRNLLIRRADMFISISSSVTKEYLNGGVSSEKIKHIPNGVDTRRFHPVSHHRKFWLRQKLGLPEGKTIVIFVGRLVVYKGPLLLVRVWKGIVSVHSDVYLVFVGPGEDSAVDCESELRNFVKAQALDRHTHFTGAVENVHEYLQASDIFILPSDNEVFPNSLLEAMSCGLPVIAAPSGGAMEIVQNGGNGIHAGSFDELYTALDTLLRDKTLASSLGHAARKIVLERYDKRREINEYIDLFSSLNRSI
jgi:glycosyltransferase involved in cell wall biosynthesis